MKFELVVIEGEELVRITPAVASYDCGLGSTPCYFVRGRGCTKSTNVSCSDPDSFFFTPQQAIQLRLKS